MTFASSTISIVKQLATKYDVEPSVLVGLIQEESKWNPKAKNPLSSARGLIQFIDATAQQLGYHDSLDLVTKHPTIDEQLLGPVQAYFDLYAPYDSKESFILSIFYPAWRNRDLSTELPTSVKKVNPGIDTLGDYVDKVEKNISKMAIVKDFLNSDTGGISLSLIAMLAIGFLFFLRRS